MSRVMVLAVLGLLVSMQGTPGVSTPVWAKPDHFWFSKAVGGGHLYFTVDARHGVKEPLFDHQRLAIELNLRTGYEYAPLTLPFADSASQFAVKYDSKNAYIQEGAMAVEFALDGMHWRCELQIKWDWNKVPPTDYECLPRRPASTPPTPPTPPTLSPDRRYAVEIRNNNVWLSGVGGVSALTTDGTADFAWDAGSLTWSADSQSITGYRLHAGIWRAPSITANVKKLVQRGSWAIPPTPPTPPTHLLNLVADGRHPAGVRLVEGLYFLHQRLE